MPCRLTAFAPLGLIVAGLVAGGGGFEAAVAPSAVFASSRCEATGVHYKPRAGIEVGLAPYPWIAASPASAGIVGHLFYYPAVKAWMRAQAPGLEIYTRGQTPNGRASMKVLWDFPRVQTALPVQLRGKRLDRAGSFVQTFSPAGPTRTGPTQYPSIIDVPAPGCWRLTLTTGTSVGRITMLAVR
jgi:hypothetical protein